MLQTRLLQALLLLSLLLNAGLIYWVSKGSRQLAVEAQQPADWRPKKSVLLDAAELTESLSEADLDILFEAGDMPAALQGYLWLNTHRHGEAQKLKTRWLALLTDQIDTADRLDVVDKFITQARAIFPEDDDFLALQVDYLSAIGDTLAAVDVLYQRINSVEPSRQGFYVSRLQKILKRAVDELIAAQAWQQLIDLGQHLLWYEPQHPPYGLLTARAYMYLKNYAAAQPLLQSIRYDSHYGEQAKTLLEEIALVDLQRNSIALTARGAHYLVDGALNSHYPIRLMIDTGASMSVISSAALKTMNIAPPPEFVREAQINTAGGRVTASIYRFASFAIENYSLSNVEFVVMPLQQSGGSVGLLGMNFLNKFAFHIDQKNDLLVLEPQ
jgi:clan AA aspartic protease (TIGR02281 family)